MRITLTRLFIDFSQDFFDFQKPVPRFLTLFLSFSICFLANFSQDFFDSFHQVFFVWCAKRTARQGTHPPWVPANKADAGGTPRQKQP